MQEFFINYGLWLLVALLIVIGLIFLLTGRKKPTDPVATERPIERVAPIAPAAPVAEVPAAPPVEPMASAAPSVIEPITTPAVAEEAIPVSPAVTTPDSTGDDLLKLKGVGPKLNQLLIELGVTRYAQIAGWTDADIAAIDAKLGNFRGRPVRDQWIDQARYLAAGDTAGFEAKYGKL